MRRLFMTMGAVLTALALSASVALASGPVRVTLRSSEVRASAQGCSHAATFTAAAKSSVGHPKPKTGKPAKPDKPEQSDENDGDEEQPSDNERPQNHGWFVSQVAKDHSVTGRDHGKAVSEVARSDEGKPDKASH